MENVAFSPAAPPGLVVGFRTSDGQSGPFAEIFVSAEANK